MAEFPGEGGVATEPSGDGDEGVVVASPPSGEAAVAGDSVLVDGSGADDGVCVGVGADLGDGDGAEEGDPDPTLTANF